MGSRPKNRATGRSAAGLRALCAGLSVVCMVCVLALVPACTGAPPPPPPPPTGPQTKEEVAKELRPILEPLREAVRQGETNPDHALGAMERQGIMDGIRKMQQEHGAKPFALEAFQELGLEMIELSRQAATNENWENVAAGIDIHELLALESPRMEFLDKQAQENLGRPKVIIKGFFGDVKKDGLFVIYDAIDRRTGKVKQYSLREGEEGDGLRVVKIIGDNMAVRFEYLKIPGLYFDVKAP